MKLNGFFSGLGSKRALVLGLSVSALACAAEQIPQVTSLQVDYARQSRPQTTLGELEEGRHAYASHCSNCHRLVDPREVSVKEWPGKVFEMGPKARLPQRQMELIVLYLVATAETAPRIQ
ncbi:MAG TPA: hypothetical protein VL137_16120 [Polyangiaceae bacterium]|nr:hypothetical protein [Polyangiaceae bacterium]